MTETKVFLIDGPAEGRIIPVPGIVPGVNVYIPGETIMDDGYSVQYAVSRIGLFGRRILAGHMCPLGGVDDAAFAFFVKPEVQKLCLKV